MSDALSPAPSRSGILRLVRMLATGAGLSFFALNASGAGCYPESAFLCSTNEECVGMGAEGVCEANAFCSYPDLECPTGRRWHDRATDSLAGNCIDPGTGTGLTDTDTDPTTDGSGSGTTDDPTLTGSSTGTSTSTTTGTSSSTTAVGSDSSTSGDPMTSSGSGGSSSGTAGTGAGTCDATYGGAADYMLCEETMESCSFNVTTAMVMSCNDVCTSFGGTCTGAELNEVELCTSTGAGTCDQMDAGDLICVCTNI